MNKPNALMVIDKEDKQYLELIDETPNWNLFYECINYKKIYNQIGHFQKRVIANNIDFIVYSRNDQVADKIRIGPITKKLEIGYTSISGIDEKYRIKEMKQCFQDFIECDKYLPMPEIKAEKNNSFSLFDPDRLSFSLLFDLEQIGCVLHALPRILAILDRYNIKATFFLTNILKKIYPNLPNYISARGHEIGVHGRWHEYLSVYTAQEQKMLIGDIIKDLSLPIYGANFIERMNKDTLDALIFNNLEYFVYPTINNYKVSCYPKLSTYNRVYSNGDKKITAIPISVETYGKPWFSIKNMVDSAIYVSSKQNRHFSILLHPFRDGNLQNIQTLFKLAQYLSEERGMAGITLKDSVSKQENAVSKNSNKLKYGLVDTFCPKTMLDIKGVIPENIFMIYRIAKNKKTAF
jgi:peptidoglycan/xylan/chitin deacetylase (PgdA/CDA1 family)